MKKLAHSDDFSLNRIFFPILEDFEDDFFLKNRKSMSYSFLIVIIHKSLIVNSFEMSAQPL